MTQNGLQKAAVLLSLISVIVVILGVKIVTNKMDTIASMQFGGAANYQTAQKLFTNPKFIEQQKKQLDNALQQIEGAPTAAQPDAAKPDTTTPPKEEFIGGTLTQDQIATLKKNAVVEGDAKAKYTIIEYSDPECPYCIRHFADGTIASVIGAYPAGQVNHIFKPVQGVNHAGTEYKSLAILCAGKLK